jgi:dimethylargininase
MEPRHALVREPGDLYTSCLSEHPLHHTVNLKKARQQHAKYCETLRELGLEILYIPRDDEHPDSCFVEDNAVVENDRALICRMAKTSRRGEQPEVAAALEKLMPIKWATAPATIEGGDVIHVDGKLISGISDRTNYEGVAQMQEWLEVPVSTIFDPTIMHLKSYVTYLGKGIMISTEKYANHPALEGYNILIPPAKEEYAADTLTVGETVLMASGYNTAQTMVREAGFDIISMDVSEIQKCDGALTCLSILF